MNIQVHVFAIEDRWICLIRSAKATVTAEHLSVILWSDRRVETQSAIVLRSRDMVGDQGRQPCGGKPAFADQRALSNLVLDEVGERSP